MLKAFVKDRNPLKKAFKKDRNPLKRPFKKDRNPLKRPFKKDSVFLLKACFARPSYCKPCEAVPSVRRPSYRP